MVLAPDSLLLAGHNTVKLVKSILGNLEVDYTTVENPTRIGKTIRSKDVTPGKTKTAMYNE